MPVVRRGSNSMSSPDRPGNIMEPFSEESKGPKRKHTRQSQSCDACRARKVKCARDGVDDAKQSSCKHCVNLGIPCTYDYQPKKRGPPNLYIRRLQEAAAAAAAAHQDSRNVGHASISPLSARHSSSPTQTKVSPSSSHSSVHSPYLEPALTQGHPPASFPFSSRQTLADDGFHPQYSSTSSIAFGNTVNGYNLVSPRNGDSQSYPSSSESFSNYSLYNWSHKHQQPATVPSPPVATTSSPSLHYRPHRLEDVASRETLMLIVTLFFDFVYPLTPCIHKPSFMADLHSRRDERDPLFFALVMSTVASTLVQVPRSYLPMERHVVRKLAQACHEASRQITVLGYDPPSSTHVAIRYFDSVYHFCAGHEGTQYATFGEAAHLAVTLRMHEETSYERLNPVEAEVRRRIFWLLFGADKSMAILVGRPVCFRDEDCTVHFPKELDDEYITHSAYVHQPQGQTALVTGLNYISRIFALLGEVLVRIRVDKRSPPQGRFAATRLEEVRALHSRVLTCLLHAPEPFRLNHVHSPSHLLSEHGISGFRRATFAEVKDFFNDPNASRDNASNPFLVMQANIYVTQQLVRYVIEQYRDELVASLQGGMNGHQVSEDQDAVASDLLNILHNIPIQSIATNGPSLVQKVRYVASTLLDTVQKAETATRSTSRAHAYLWDFLTIMSEIERNYLLEDDGTQNRDPRVAMMPS